MTTTLETRIIKLEINAATLDDLLAGAALAAHSKADLPALNAVRLALTDGVLTATATDRYRLFHGVSNDLFTDNTDDSFEILIPLNFAKAIRSNLKPLIGRIARPVTVEIEDDFIRLVTLDGTWNYRGVSGTFPPFAQLLTDTYYPMDAVSLNPKLLADMAKVPGLDKNIPLVLRSTGEKKALIAQVNTDRVNWKLLLMPMRTPNA